MPCIHSIARWLRLSDDPTEDGRKDNEERNSITSSILRTGLQYSPLNIVASMRPTHCYSPLHVLLISDTMSSPGISRALILWEPNPDHPFVSISSIADTSSALPIDLIRLLKEKKKEKRIDATPICPTDDVRTIRPCPVC